MTHGAGNNARISEIICRSSGPTKMTGLSRSLRIKKSANWANLSIGQHLPGWPAPGKKPNQRRPRISGSFAQHQIDRAIIFGSSDELRNAWRVFDTQWPQHVEVAIDQMLLRIVLCRPAVSD